MFQWEDSVERDLPEFVQVSHEIEALGDNQFKWFEKRIRGLKDNVVRAWTRDFKAWEYPFAYRWICQLRDLLGKKNEDMKVMDFGCGVSPFPEFLARKGFNVIGVEQSFTHYPRPVTEEDVKKAYPTAKYFIGDVINVPPYGGFDAIVSCSVVEHIIDPPGKRLEIMKTLKSLLNLDGKVMHIADYYFPGHPKKKTLSKRNINFYEMVKELNIRVPDMSMVPESPWFDFKEVRGRVRFMRSGVKASRIALGDDVL